MPQCSADVITESNVRICYAPFVLWTLADFSACYASFHSEGINLRNRFGIQFARFVNLNRWLFFSHTKLKKNLIFIGQSWLFSCSTIILAIFFVRIVIVYFCSHFRKLPPLRLCSLSVEFIFRKSTLDAFKKFAVGFDCKQNLFLCVSHTCFDRFFIFDDLLSAARQNEIMFQAINMDAVCWAVLCCATQ